MKAHQRIELRLGGRRRAHYPVDRRCKAGEIEAKIAFAPPQRRGQANVALEPESAARKHDNGKARRAIVSGLGRTFDAAVSLPQGAPATKPEDNVSLEYDLDLGGGETKLALYLVPTLDTEAHGGLRVGGQLDDRPVQILTLRPAAMCSSSTGSTAMW